MKKTTFGAIDIGDVFYYDGIWYVKMPPNRRYNARMCSDEQERFWFDTGDIVYIN